MKRIIPVLFAMLVVILFPDLSFAQEKNDRANPSALRFSIASDAGLPVGVLGDRYKWSMGTAIQIEKPVIKNRLSFLASTGYTRIFARSGKLNARDLELMPLRAGLKYFPVGNFYIQGQAGASFVFKRQQSGYDRSVIFSYVPQMGYQFPIGSNFIDAGLRWEGNAGYKKSAAFNNTFGIRLAYNFSL